MADLDTSDSFSIICQHKDTKPSNLNQVFASYGCNTLEAKVPIVSKHVIEDLQGANREEQTMGALMLKGESGSNAVEGRIPRTHNRELKLVDLGNDTMIAAGKERERSPVDKDELDEEIESYMKVTAKMREERRKRIELQRQMLEKERARPRLFEIPNVSDENMTLDTLLDNMKS